MEVKYSLQNRRKDAHPKGDLKYQCRFCSFWYELLHWSDDCNEINLYRMDLNFELLNQSKSIPGCFRKSLKETQKVVGICHEKKKTTIVFFLKNETHRKIQLIYLILKFFGLGWVTSYLKESKIKIIKWLLKIQHLLTAY